ncbi:MAG: glycosyltransferase [Limisphaerales bacterium]
MRVAVLNAHGGVVGGLEIYVQRVLPALGQAGLEAELFFQHAPDAVRPPLASGGGVHLGQLPDDRAFGRIEEWKPDVLYVNSPLRPALIRRAAARWPVIVFQHSYYGTCINGGKFVRLPVARPCERVFGPACLACWYPRRCGGWNPASVWHGFQLQREWLGVLRSSDAVACHSVQMQAELGRHGIPPGRAPVVPFLVPPDDVAPAKGSRLLPAEGPLRLLFLGRLETVKGAHLLLEAAPGLAAALGRRIEIVLAGDGPERERLAAKARVVMSRHPAVTVELPGWIGAAERAQQLAAAQLLVVPSIWPEPFGQTGVEAGHFGVPAAAFNVGGVRAWLTPGVNGHLAPGRPATAAGLGAALRECLHDAGHYARLSAGAREQAAGFNAARHVAALTETFTAAISRRGGRQS